MKIFTCLFLLLSTGCLAQTFTFNQGGPASKNYYEEIPYENINGKIFIEVEIGGKKRRFLFDTGGPVVISKQLAAELNAKVLNKILLGDAFLHADSTKVVEINGLKLGGLSFNHIPAATGLPDFVKCYNVDGSIGSNLLRNSIVSIVPAKHLIILTDQKGKLTLKSKNSTRLTTNIGTLSSPFVNIVIKGKRNVIVSIVFDTGDDSFLQVESRLVGEINRYAAFDTLARGYGADRFGAYGMQNAGDKYLFKVAPMVIGNGNFINLVTESNKNADPCIGSRLLDYGTATLDFIHGKFYFDANEPVNDLAEKQWPFRPAFVNGKLIVGVVFQKAVGRLQPGDQIMAVNDSDYSHPIFCDLVARKKMITGKEIAVLTIKDAQGAIKKVTVKRESVIPGLK
jgi:predicted aspartyl protease